VDDLAFANVYAPDQFVKMEPGVIMPFSLGPFVEFLMHLEAETLPRAAIDWLNISRSSDFVTAWLQGYPRWLSSNSHLGFIRTRGYSDSWYMESTSFLMKARQAARDISRLPGSVPGQMAAAIQELEGNIHEHSEAVSTGVLVFRATHGVFEFVVADNGIGLLRSLRSSPMYADLEDHGSALRLALTDGATRYDDPLRGHGFRPIFQGLTDVYGYLRFRTGDHAIVMDGTNPALATAQVSQKTRMGGFFASVRCGNGVRGRAQTGNPLFMGKVRNEHSVASQWPREAKGSFGRKRKEANASPFEFDGWVNLKPLRQKFVNCRGMFLGRNDVG
jgi:hypothetical protein